MQKKTIILVEKEEVGEILTAGIQNLDRGNVNANIIFKINQKYYRFIMMLEYKSVRLLEFETKADCLASIEDLNNGNLLDMQEYNTKKLH